MIKKILILVLIVTLFQQSHSQSLNTLIDSATSYKNANVKTNGLNLITGSIMNTALQKIIDALHYIDSTTKGVTLDSIQVQYPLAIEFQNSIKTLLLKNHIDSVSIVAGMDYWWSAGVPHLIGSRNTGSGIDSTAFFTFTAATDSSYGKFTKRNGQSTVLRVISDDEGNAVSTPSLQQVTDVGNTTSNDIISNSKVAAPIISATSHVLIGVPIPSVQNAALYADNITFVRSLELPDADGILALSVNGNFADVNGNITVSTSSGSTYSASNGLTMAGTNIQLGGTMSKSDTINMAQHGLYFVSKYGQFNVGISSGVAAVLTDSVGTTALSFDVNYSKGAKAGGQLNFRSAGSDYTATIQPSDFMLGNVSFNLPLLPVGLSGGTLLSSACSSTATLSSGTVTVSTDIIKTGAKIFVSVNTPSGTQGFLSAPTASIINGTSFVINSTSATDNSTVNYQIINP